MAGGGTSSAGHEYEDREMTQTMLTPATHSVSHRETLDVAVIITFMPSDPVDVAVVEIVGDDVPVARYLALVEAASIRLASYAEDFRQAVESDTE